MEWTDLSKIIIGVVLLAEGILAYFRIRGEWKKKLVEKKSQHVTESWHADIKTQIAQITTIGDLVYNDYKKELILKRIKNVKEELTYILYCLSLFSLDKPIKILQALNYFKDRKDAIDKEFLKLFKIKLEAYKSKEKDYKVIKDNLSQMLPPE